MKRSKSEKPETSGRYTVKLVCHLTREWSDTVDRMKVSPARKLNYFLTIQKSLLGHLGDPRKAGRDASVLVPQAVSEYFNASPMPYDPSSEICASMMRAAQAYRWAKELSCYGDPKYLRALELLSATILNTPLPGSEESKEPEELGEPEGQEEAEVLGGD